MGGRSGQSADNSGSPSIDGGNFTDSEKIDILSHAKKEMKRLGIKDDIKIKVIAGKNELAGSVVLKETPEKIKSITISTNSNLSPKSLISHELTHVEQINNGKLYLEKGNIIYKGEKVMSTKEYNKKFKGKWTKERLKEYENLPWERPAYKSE